MLLGLFCVRCGLSLSFAGEVGALGVGVDKVVVVVEGRQRAREDGGGGGIEAVVVDDRVFDNTVVDM
jgi:hypothetical protein